MPGLSKLRLMFAVSSPRSGGRPVHLCADVQVPGCAVEYHQGFAMLRAALIGLASSGKTTLFQLMTSARETARASHGKGETSIGISKVPDPRLDRLTAMFNPKKRVPATVEFTDLAAAAAGGAKALVDVAAYKNAARLVHVLRAFPDPAVPHPSGSVDPARDAQAMEDELILADLGVAERRLQRLGKKVKKTHPPHPQPR